MCFIYEFFGLINAQDYQITFTGSGQSTSVESVYVENLTQGTEITLAGSDVLHLVGTVGVSSQIYMDKKLNIYPNPIKESCKIQFYSEKPDNVKIEVFDLNGKIIENYSCNISSGMNIFEMSGFSKGIYTLSVSTSEWRKSSSFISVNDIIGKNHVFKNVSSNTLEPKNNMALKSTKNLVQMQYNNGDILLLKGVSGDYARILTIVPSQTQSVDFEFVECTDLGGNNYAVVTIGAQTWMAENLKYLPSVVGPNTGSETTPYYYVYDYNGTDVTAAKATENYATYGVLYNWPAAMHGSASSSANPSGVQGICPDGWHLPSDAEWTQLTDYLGGESVAGGKLKETGTTHWNSPNTGATNEIGFTTLPGGIREYSDHYFIGDEGYWWSATEYDIDLVWFRELNYYTSDVSRGISYKDYGLSVRCIKD